MSAELIHYAETRFGFEYGAAKVERMFSDKGTVHIRICSKRCELIVYITRTGLMRVYRDNPRRELKP